MYTATFCNWVTIHSFLGMVAKFRLYIFCVRKKKLTPEAVVWRCSVEKKFMEISQNSLEITCARVSFLTKMQDSASNFIKRDSSTGVSLWILRNFEEHIFYRTPPVSPSVTQNDFILCKNYLTQVNLGTVRPN